MIGIEMSMRMTLIRYQQNCKGESIFKLDSLPIMRWRRFEEIDASLTIDRLEVFETLERSRQ